MDDIITARVLSQGDRFPIHLDIGRIGREVLSRRVHPDRHVICQDLLGLRVGCYTDTILGCNLDPILSVKEEPVRNI